MEIYLLWLIVGFTLVLLELMTGTFFLLVLGIAAFIGSAMSWLGQPFWIQAAAASAVAVIGVVVIRRGRELRKMSPTGPNAIDVGQMVTVDSWVNEADGIARVRYRGALWDARVTGERSAGGTYFIRGVEGSTLRIVASKH